MTVPLCRSWYRWSGLAGLLVGALLLGMQTWAVEIRHWDRKPLVIPLPVDAERIVTLDRNVRVGLPPTIADPEVLRVQSAGGVLYLKAFEAFDPQRVQLQDVETGEILLLDLSAREGASHEEIRVVDVEPQGDGQAATTASDATQSSSGGRREARETTAPALRAPIPVVLTRYAAQSLYSPLRLIGSVPGLHRTPMRLPETLPSLLPSLPVTATPLGAWTLEGWTVTAVRLESQDPRRAFELDPRWLQGDFHSATFMHPSIGPRGSVEDTTTVFLVTSGDLANALLPATSPEAGLEANEGEPGGRP
ncbi:hypothetical protein L861_06550 [Litchfieldella anticariensis FP35 = DSM 16096]|uniref:Integrating conjugative element protein n=1 Tax=Litchfieldella anticariensis (strain DSM 16096 / CECT 5854 / CIP 108499 / LMG 22089 / FP35) TaxID=1121939 RepID=S2KYW4_LITA3|nr:TIGR03749 family integrating conjugative element protein [Halomonas anticariensis]EPC00594.1 hypothetical protein L861_06550 [Halomonas anticariensis FP35 = DSM 16096]